MDTCEKPLLESFRIPQVRVILGTQLRQRTSIVADEFVFLRYFRALIASCKMFRYQGCVSWRERFYCRDRHKFPDCVMRITSALVPQHRLFPFQPCYEWAFTEFLQTSIKIMSDINVGVTEPRT